jgi:putative solute:sodium symporter small subunit
MQDEEKYEKHWEKTQRLMYIMMGLWIFFSFFIHMFVSWLNAVKILGFPMGFYMAAQGSLVVFVAMLYWFAKAQDDIDEEFGVAEDR